MKFIDENDEVFSHFVWYENSQLNWTTYEVPEGHEIIGIYMSKKSIGSEYKESIEALGFILWKPNPAIIDGF